MPGVNLPNFFFHVSQKEASPINWFNVPTLLIVFAFFYILTHFQGHNQGKGGKVWLLAYPIFTLITITRKKNIKNIVLWWPSKWYVTKLTFLFENSKLPLSAAKSLILASKNSAQT